jgi:ubiquinone/menaquinone biosynthesis C-methylase UbiE
MDRKMYLEHLGTKQYGTADNFNARTALHARFRTNRYGFHRWVFDRIMRLPIESHILELGCGPGWLWRANAGRIPVGWIAALTDFSPGMAKEARAQLGARPVFRFAVADAQWLPFADGRFDAVIANHMLYHVPERERAYAEMRRILRPGGRVFASTFGLGHMREFSALVSPFSVRPTAPLFPRRFVLENGGEELARWFADVTMERYEDELAVTEAEPLVAYALSMTQFIPDTTPDKAERVARLTESIERAIAAHGALRISTETGLFTAVRQ